MAENWIEQEKSLSREKEFMEMAEEAVSEAKMVKGKSKRLYWNSLYYSLFYGAKAVLLSLGEDANTHSGTDNQVGRILYKEKGLISKESASFYSDIRRIREEIDYQPDATVNRNPDKALDKVEEILKNLRDIMERQK